MYTTEYFIAKSRKIHGDKYDYSKVSYIGRSVPVIIICSKHGEFLQSPQSHFCGRGCKKCWTDRYTLTEEDFLSRSKEIHNNKYDYSLVVYKKYTEKVKIICSVHGMFKQTPAHHIKGDGCKKCAIEYTADKKRKTTEEFIVDSKKIYRDLFLYDKTQYIANDKPLILTCKKHGDFIKTPTAHLANKQGCPRCKCSKNENLIEDWLINKNITYIRQAMFGDCRGVGGRRLRFDFFLSDFNVCIEFDGPQHTSKKFYSLIGNEDNYERLVKNDEIKNKYCLIKGIYLIRIKYNERKNIDKIMNYYLSTYLRRAV